MAEGVELPALRRLPSMRLLRTYPTRQYMTRRFFSDVLAFQCRECRSVKESRYRVESPAGVICGQCYSDKLAGIPIIPLRDVEQPARKYKTGVKKK